MAPVEIGVLGSLEVRSAGAVIEMRGARLRTALATLVIHAPHPVSADAIATAVWGENLPARPHGAVQTIMFRLRAAIGESVVRTGPAGYNLELPADAVDVARFEELCRRAGTTPPQQGAVLLDSALELWRGPAYSEFADMDVARAEAVRLDELWMHFMERRAMLALELGDADGAVSRLQRVVDEQPLREHAHGLLMTALSRAGRTADALDHFQTLRQHLAQELGLDPSPTLRDLQVQILGHAVPQHTGPALQPSLPRPPHLPPGWQPAGDLFIGREDESLALLRAVTDGRLVCVTGPGGVGKSRLVAEVLPELSRRLARPVAVVELADAAPGEVDETVAATLRLGATSDPRAAVIEYLGATSLILVLDGCEGVREQTRSFVEPVWRTAPRVHLVVTSRRRLELEVEQVLPLGTLPSPCPADPPDRAVTTPAMRLFLERMRRLRPATDLTGPVVDDAGEMCRLLDGLPLALELAATQAATVGVRAVREELAAGVQLGGSEAGSLRAVVARSYDLLEGGDRALLSRLASFSAGFGLDDAEQVAPEGQARSGLSRLVHASLVTPIEGEIAPRFRLLGPVRAYASEWADADTPATFWRWAADRSDMLSEQAVGPGATTALALLDLTQADLAAAAAGAISGGRVDLAARIVGNAGSCVHWVPGTALAEVTIQVGDHPDLPGAEEASRARAAAAMVAVERGELDRAERLGLSALRAAVTTQERYLALTSLSVAAVYAGERGKAARLWQEVASLDDLSAAYVVDAHAALALVLVASGATADAELHAAAASRAAERSGAAPRLAFALYASGEVLLTSDVEAAADVLREAARVADTSHAEQIATVTRVALLSALARSGRTADALDLSRTLLDLQQRRGHWPQAWTTMRILAEVFTLVGRLETAELVLAAAESDESAPNLAGADVDRYRQLRTKMHQELGTDRAHRIAALARLLPRTQILDRVRSAVVASSTQDADLP
ncbi:AfsR/SARP family transcriptional regulator [Brachybacterium vulturis]|nr:BTAD domain-containing putative transcriptional regulator [Brachybacterium vulturis]